MEKQNVKYIDLNNHVLHRKLNYLPSLRFVPTSHEEYKFMTTNWKTVNLYKSIGTHVYDRIHSTCPCLIFIAFNILNERVVNVSEYNILTDTAFYNFIPGFKFELFGIGAGGSIVNNDNNSRTNFIIQNICRSFDEVTFDKLCELLVPNTCRVSQIKLIRHGRTVLTTSNQLSTSDNVPNLVRTKNLKKQCEKFYINRYGNRVKSFIGDSEMFLHRRVTTFLIHHRLNRPLSSVDAQDLCKTINRFNKYKQLDNNNNVEDDSGVVVRNLKSIGQRNVRRIYDHTWSSSSSDSTKENTNSSNIIVQCSRRLFTFSSIPDVCVENNKFGKTCPHVRLSSHAIQTRSGDECESIMQICSDCGRIVQFTR